MSQQPQWGGEAVPFTSAPDSDRLAREIYDHLATGQPAAVTTTHWPPMALALLRGSVEGLIVAGVAAFAVLTADPEIAPKIPLIAAGAAFFARLAAAVGVGSLDSFNARRPQ